MGPNERRAAILDALCIRRQDTVSNLAMEFNVNEKTIRRDIEELSCSYPLETVRGRFGGGVKVSDWYRPSRRTLSKEQAALLMKLAPGLKGRDLEVMNSIISQFAPYS
jgi:DeoR/GlpR family transcriptional regulator of sugar metabolism